MLLGEKMAKRPAKKEPEKSVPNPPNIAAWWLAGRINDLGSSIDLRIQSTVSQQGCARRKEVWTATIS